MKRQSGFTLIELMIVVAIIGALAGIVIPRYARMIEKSKEGATKGNLGAIRSAVSIYYAEKESNWPGDLTISFTSYLYPIPPAMASPLGRTNAVKASSALPGPIVRLRGQSRAQARAAAASQIGWCYVTDTTSPYAGSVFPNSTATDTKGNSFTTY